MDTQNVLLLARECVRAADIYLRNVLTKYKQSSIQFLSHADTAPYINFAHVDWKQREKSFFSAESETLV